MRSPNSQASRASRSTAPGGRPATPSRACAGAGEQDGVMVGLEVELRSQLGFGLVAHLGPDGVADLVAVGLAGPGEVALHLALRAGLRIADGVDHVLGRLFAGPALGV